MEVNSLVLNVKSDTVSTASKRLDKFEDKAGKATRANRQLSASSGVASTATAKQGAAAAGAATSFTGLAGAQTTATATTRGMTGALATMGATMATVLAPLLAIIGPLLAFKKVLGSTVEIQDFRAQLKTATGSMENAAIAFEAVEDFASRTPYALEQSLQGFIKLTNLGLTPSERALESYGNTASAMGKDLTQLIEAVADATTGEFERLKEFGIKASSEGDRVKFTFRGVTTEIGKNAAEIEGYLMSIGENEFGGAMSARMETVGGQISNLGDLWDQLFRTISEMGVGSLIGSSIQVAIDAIDGLIGMLQSGEFEKSLESWTAGFEGWADDFELTMSFVSGVFKSETEDMGEDSAGIWETFVDAIKAIPAMVRYWVKRMGIEIVALGDYALIAGKAIFATIGEYLSLTVNASVEAAKAIGEAIMNPIETFNNGGIDWSGVTGATTEASVRISKVISDAEDKLDVNRKTRIDLLGEIQDEYDATALKIVETARESDSLREAYEREKQARKDARSESGDRLERFKIEPKGGTGTSATSGGKKSGATKSSGPTDFEKLVEELRKEELAIEGSYLKRLELIRNNTEAGSELRAELEEKVSQQYQQDIEKFAEKTISEYDITKAGFSLQLEEIDSFYQRRKELILQNETLTEEEKTALVLQMTEERNELVKNLEMTRAKQGLEMADNFFGNFAQLAKSGNKKLAKIGEAALKAQKAIAITQATIKTYESATSAYASMASIPVVGPALGVAAAAGAIAAGLANVAAIATSPTTVGSYAAGGIVPGSSYSGDSLTANVNSAEMILNRQQQAQLFNMANGGGSQNGGGNVVIINQTTTPVEAETRVNAKGEREITIREAVNRTKAELTNEADTGGGTVVPALQRNFELRRRGA